MVLYVQRFYIFSIRYFVIIKSYGVGVVYDFGGHYEVDSPLALKVYGLVVLSKYLCHYNYWYLENSNYPRKERMALIFINIGVFCTLFIPGFCKCFE